MTMKRRILITPLAMVAIVLAVMLVSTSAAFAAAGATAQGIQVNGLGTIVSVGPLSQSTFPAGAPDSVASVNVPGLVTTGVLDTDTNGDSDAGTSDATATVNGLNASLGGAPLSLVGLQATTVQATCTGNPDGTSTGSTTLTNANLTVAGVGVLALDANPAPNTSLVNANLSGLASVVLNEQSTSGGTLTVTAIHITLLSGTGIGSEIIIGRVSCGPNAPVEPVPVIPLHALPFLGAAGLVGGGAYATARTRARRALVKS